MNAMRVGTFRALLTTFLLLPLATAQAKKVDSKQTVSSKEYEKMYGTGGHSRGGLETTSDLPKAINHEFFSETTRKELEKGLPSNASFSKNSDRYWSEMYKLVPGLRNTSEVYSELPPIKTEKELPPTMKKVLEDFKKGQKIYKTEKEFRTRFKDSGLSFEEQYAIDFYSSEGYRCLNSYFRTGYPDTTFAECHSMDKYDQYHSQIKATAALLVSGLCKLQKHSGTVKRMSSVPKEFMSGIEKAGKFIDTAPLSTSKRKDWHNHWDGRELFEIETQGHSCVDIQSFSANKNESEVLCLPGTIMSIKRDGDIPIDRNDYYPHEEGDYYPGMKDPNDFITEGDYGDFEESEKKTIPKYKLKEIGTVIDCDKFIYKPETKPTEPEPVPPPQPSGHRY